MKRTPLTRRSPLKPGKATLARSRMRRVGKRKERELDAIKAFSKAVLKRDPVCVRCAKRKATEAHHLVRKSRSVGHKNAHHPDAGAGLCRACHAYVHDHPSPEWIKPLDYLDSL